MAEPTESDIPPAYPEQRQKEGARGRAVTLADGREWLLHPTYFEAIFDEVRDEVFDQIHLRGRVDKELVLKLAWVQLGFNYEITQAEFLFLVNATLGREDLKDGFTKAVLDQAILNTNQQWTYSDWVRTAFFVGGVDPRAAHDHDLPALLAQLVASGRVADPNRYVAALKARQKRTQLDTIGPPPGV